MKTPTGEAVMVALLRLTLAGRLPVLSASGELEAMLGFPPADFLSGKVALPQLFHPDDAELTHALFSADDPRRAGVLNVRLRQANGKIRCIKASFTKATGPDGVSLDLLLQDAKTLKRTIADTAAAINFRAIMEGTDDYVYFKDRNHVFTGASQTLVSLCPEAKHWSELIGQTDYDVFPEVLADCYYRLEKQIFEGLPIAREIQPTVDKAGRKGWVDNRKYPIRDDDGTIIGLYGIARDITELKQAAVVHESDAALAERSRQALVSAMEDQKRVHAAVREREARYAVMVNSISDAIVSADSAGQIIAWNPGAERIFGYPAREILGQSLRLLIPPRHLEHHDAGMARVLAGGPHHIIGTTMEAEGRRQDGSEFPLNLSLSEWQIGPQKFFTAVIRDITEQRAAAENLAAKLEELRRWQGATLGREGRVLELKREINALRAKHGEAPKYPSVAEGGGPSPASRAPQPAPAAP